MQGMFAALAAAGDGERRSLYAYQLERGTTNVDSRIVGAETKALGRAEVGGIRGDLSMSRVEDVALPDRCSSHLR